MSRTFNTCADVKVSYLKTLLGCKNKFNSFVTIGSKQVLMRISLGVALDLTIPGTPKTDQDWGIEIKRGGKWIGNLKLTPIGNKSRSESIAIINAMAVADEDFSVNLTLISTKGDVPNVEPTMEQLRAIWGNLPPLAVIFEVC